MVIIDIVKDIQAFKIVSRRQSAYDSGLFTSTLQKPEGRQHGKMALILGSHREGGSETGRICKISYGISGPYYFFAMLFMQP